MKLPRGDLVASRVVDDYAVALRDALDDAVTGYLVLEPGSTLLTGDDDAGVLTLADGVPVLASHTGTERGGPGALADLAGPGPVQVDRRVVASTALAEVHDVDGRDALAVAPGEPARVLAGDTTSPLAPANARPKTTPVVARTPTRSTRSSPTTTASPPSARRRGRRPNAAPRNGGSSTNSIDDAPPGPDVRARHGARTGSKILPERMLNNPRECTCRRSWTRSTPRTSR